MYMLTISSMERRCSKQSHNMFRTLLRYTSAYYLWLSKTCENSPPDEHAKNTPNRTHFRAVVNTKFPAYRTSQTIRQVKVSQKGRVSQKAKPHRSQGGKASQKPGSHRRQGLRGQGLTES